MRVVSTSAGVGEGPDPEEHVADAHFDNPGKIASYCVFMVLIIVEILLCMSPPQEAKESFKQHS